MKCSQSACQNMACSTFQIKSEWYPGVLTFTVSYIGSKNVISYVTECIKWPYMHPKTAQNLHMHDKPGITSKLQYVVGMFLSFTDQTEVEIYIKLE